MLQVLDIFAAARKDNDDPKRTKSRTEQTDPNLPYDRTLMAEPISKNFITERVWRAGRPAWGEEMG
jgi:hypothetical protein